MYAAMKKAGFGSLLCGPHDCSGPLFGLMHAAPGGVVRWGRQTHVGCEARVWRFDTGKAAPAHRKNIRAHDLQVTNSDVAFVEHSGFEPLTPTLPVLCATSCANAPRTRYILSYRWRFVKGFCEKNEKFFVFRPVGVGRLRGAVRAGSRARRLFPAAPLPAAGQSGIIAFQRDAARRTHELRRSAWQDL